MNYTFPKIYDIGDVIDIVQSRDEFMISDRGDYTVIDYTVAFADTFPPIDETNAMTYYNTSVMREFRGLVFCSHTGKILRRPYHKFFNYGEREETKSVKFRDLCSIYTKLDGSMISPFITQDRVIHWGTRKVAADFEASVVQWLQEQDKIAIYRDFARDVIDTGLTPIFEWMSPDNRIVVDYRETDLVLTGIRNMNSGDYIDVFTIDVVGALYNIPTVNTTKNKFSSMEDLSKVVYSMDNEEGYVLEFSGGHRMKVKSDWYCQLHKVKAFFTFEKDVVRIILDNQLDDMLSVLDKNDSDKINAYSVELHGCIKKIYHDVVSILRENISKGYTRKDYAINSKNNRMIDNLVYTHFDLENIEELENSIIKHIRNNTSSGPRWETFKNNNNMKLEW